MGEHCRMLLHTPYYIILGEFAIAATIARLASKVRLAQWRVTLPCGLLAGLAIFPSYAVAWAIVDRL